MSNNSSNKFDTVEIEKNKILEQLMKFENANNIENENKFSKEEPKKETVNIPQINYEKKASQMTLPEIDIKSFTSAQKQAKKDFKKYIKNQNEEKINPEGAKVKELLNKVNRSPEQSNSKIEKQNFNNDISNKINILSNKKISDNIKKIQNNSDFNQEAKNENGFFKNLFTYEDFDDGEELYEPEIFKKREVISDFNTPEDAISVKKDLSAQLKFTLLKFITCIIIFIPFLLINLWTLLNPPFLKILDFSQNQDIFCIFNFSALFLMTVICAPAIFGGIINLLHFKADYDSLPALCVIAAFINEIIIFLSIKNNYNEKVYSFAFIAGFLLIMNLIGKLYAVNNLKGNFSLITAKNKQKHVAVLNNNPEINKRMHNEYFDKSDKLIYSRKADFVTGFLEKSYSIKSIDKKGKIFIYSSIAVIAAAAAYLIFTKKTLIETSRILTFLIMLITPASNSIAIWLPFCKFSGKMRKQGVALLGSNSITDYKDVYGVIINDSDIFSKNSITVSGIKVFSNTRIDEMLVLLATIFIDSKSILSDVFMKILDNNKNMLLKCDKIKILRSQGIAAKIGNKKIICGNKAMLDKIGITVPDGYEKLNRCGRYVMYLAVNFKIIGVFALNYNINPKMLKILTALYKQGTAMFIKTNDPNITEDFFNDVFNIPELITIIDADTAEYISPIFEPSQRISSPIVSLSGTRGILYAVAAMNKIYNHVTASAIIRNISIIIGSILSLIITINSIFNIAVPLTVFIFQAIWTIPIILIYLFSK